MLQHIGNSEERYMSDGFQTVSALSDMNNFRVPCQAMHSLPASVEGTNETIYVQRSLESDREDVAHVSTAPLYS